LISHASFFFARLLTPLRPLSAFIDYLRYYFIFTPRLLRRCRQRRAIILLLDIFFFSCCLFAIFDFLFAFFSLFADISLNR
jgi:hypothetical protein